MKNVFFIAVILSVAILAQNKTESVSWEMIVGNQKFPEGPAWNDTAQELYVSNCYGNWITRISVGKVDTLVMADSINYIKTNGMTVSPGGIIYACDYGLGAILKIENGRPEVLIKGFEGKAFNRPNDITFDAEGNIYFTDPKSYGKDKRDGRLFYFNVKSGELKLVWDSLAFPNGLAISPYDGRLYLSESAMNRVLNFRINNDGSLSDMKLFMELPGGDPDGMNFDIDGNMYVAHFGTGTLFVISPEGKIIRRIKTPGIKPSNVEFGGKNRTILFLTEDETNAVYKTDIGAEGFVIYK